MMPCPYCATPTTTQLARRTTLGYRMFRCCAAINAQPLEKVKVRGGYDSGPSTFSSCKDRRKNSGPS